MINARFSKGRYWPTTWQARRNLTLSGLYTHMDIVLCPCLKKERAHII